MGRLVSKNVRENEVVIRELSNSLVTPFRDIVPEMKKDLTLMVTKIESEIQSQYKVKKIVLQPT